MPNDYRNNHYVPQWYQKKFLLNDENKLCYLDLNPCSFTDSNGIKHTDKDLRIQGTKASFCERDLYTRNFKTITSIEIERSFFGKIDIKGRGAVEYFENFKYPPEDWKNYFIEIILYLSTQKLRTPKGLNFLGNKVRSNNKNIILNKMIELQGIYGATWAECVWQIADAYNSNTKFIISDHPVTVYNRKCPPGSDLCCGSSDPDVLLQATQTIFPLSLNKILILTNLSWVRNPYQSERKLRPNPNYFHSTINKITDTQIERHLTEQEVCEINYIIKKRAYKYIAAAKEEWLYPEKKIPDLKWNSFGNGYLLMPDPRPIHPGGEIIWGGGPGGPGAMDEYGRTPDDPEYNIETNTGSEYLTLEWFKAEFAEMCGPYRRGRSFQFTQMDNEKDDDEFHQYHLSLRKKNYKERQSEKRKN